MSDDRGQQIRDALDDGAKPGLGKYVYPDAVAALDSLLASLAQAERDRFRFTLDAAASDANALCARYFTVETDGLAQSWADERVWCNPPYSACGMWVAKAWAEPALLVVMLLPANRTEQRWWQEMVEPHRDRAGSRLRTEFLPGRLRFDTPDRPYTDPRGNRPPFGCVLLVWGAAGDAG